jgi:hypothetical protein
MEDKSRSGSLDEATVQGRFANALAVANLRLTRAEMEALYGGYCHFREMIRRTIENPSFRTNGTDILHRLSRR